MPWGPVSSGGYIFSGSYEPNPAIVDDNIDMESYLEFIIDETLSRRGVTQVPAGRTDTFYEGTEGESKIVIDWLMEGGRLWYFDCIEIINEVRDYLGMHEELNTRPSQILVTKHGQRKFLITLTSERGDPVDLNKGAWLEFEGQYWPQRRLVWGHLRAVIDLTREAFALHHPEEIVTFADYSYRFGSVDLHIGFETVPAIGGPRVRWLELIHIVNAISSFFDEDRGRQGCELYGNLHAAARVVGIGWLRITQVNQVQVVGAINAISNNTGVATITGNDRNGTITKLNGSLIPAGEMQNATESFATS